MTRHASPLLTNHNHTMRRQGAWPWGLLSIGDQPLINARAAACAQRRVHRFVLIRSLGPDLRGAAARSAWTHCAGSAIRPGHQGGKALGAPLLVILRSTVGPNKGVPL